MFFELLTAQSSIIPWNNYTCEAEIHHNYPGLENCPQMGTGRTRKTETFVSHYRYSFAPLLLRFPLSLCLKFALRMTGDVSVLLGEQLKLPPFEPSCGNLWNSAPSLSQSYIHQLKVDLNAA